MSGCWSSRAPEHSWQECKSQEHTQRLPSGGTHSPTGRRDAGRPALFAPSQAVVCFCWTHTPPKASPSDFAPTTLPLPKSSRGPGPCPRSHWQLHPWTAARRTPPRGQGSIRITPGSGKGQKLRRATPQGTAAAHDDAPKDCRISHRNEAGQTSYIKTRRGSLPFGSALLAAKHPHVHSSARR